MRGALRPAESGSGYPPIVPKPRPKRSSSRTRKPTRYTATEEAESIELGQARVDFLQAVSEWAPEVWRDLQRDVWPAYRETFALIATARVRGSKVHKKIKVSDRNIAVTLTSDDALNWFREARERDDPTTLPLAGALERWAARHSLRAEWIWDPVLRTLRAWEGNPGLAKQLRWFMRPAGYEMLPLDELEFKITYSRWIAWDPTTGNRRQAKAEILADLEEYVDDYLDRVAKLAEQHGFVPIRRRFARRHMQWAVLYQVKGITFAAIGRQAGKTDAAVRTTVTPLLELIGLPLRRISKGGRPKSSERKPHRDRTSL